MAKQITFECGHTAPITGFRRAVDGNESHADFDRREEWLATQPCPACYSAAINADADLPTLIGSDKQIAWAETIRAEKLAEMNRLAEQIDVNAAADKAHAENPKVASADQAREALASIRGNTSSRFWIDNRSSSIVDLMRDILRAGR